MIETLPQPGPAAASRITALPCRVRPFAVTLAAGIPLGDAVAEALEAAKVPAAWLALGQAEFARLDYMLPGADPTGARAAWYDGPHGAGAVSLTHAGLHAGWRNGGRFLHCHGAWEAASGPTFGHLIPEACMLAAPVIARGWAIRGARFDAQPDEETGFSLFTPADPVPVFEGRRGVLCRLRPNQDIATALLAAAEAGGIAQGVVCGLGSLVHPLFEGGTRIDSLATEFLFTEARLSGGRARLSADLVAIGGAMHRGRLAPDENGICITAEALIIDDT